MKPAWWGAAEREIDQTLEGFTAKLKRKLQEKPTAVIRRKNPFLFRVRVVDDVHELASMVINAYLSSSEETIFGNILEDIAITICTHAKQGRKSGIKNIDLEYDVDSVRHLVQIKSGVNWGNASQRRALEGAFNSARRTLQPDKNISVQCIEGICYGKSATRHLGTHTRMVGRDFWQEISDWPDTAEGVMDVLGEHAANGLNAIRTDACNAMVDFLQEQKIADRKGRVNWHKLLDLVLGARE